jgi:predicted nucleic acid-binding protein
VLTRLDPDHALQNADDLAAMNITWAEPTVAYAQAIELARSLNHHLFDTLYHALALTIPGAELVTADRRYFDKARHLGQIAWLPDFRIA